MFISNAFAQAAGTTAAAGSWQGTVLQLGLIFAIFYLLLIRPQQKRIKQHEAKVRAVQKGDYVITGGGINAKVIDASDPVDLTVEIADGIKVSVNRGTLREVFSAEEMKQMKSQPAKKEPANSNKKSKK